MMRVLSFSGSLLLLAALLFAAIAVCILFVPGLLGGGFWAVMVGIAAAIGLCAVVDR